VGILETTTAGPPVIDADLILRFTFGGTFALTARQEGGAGHVAGSITGDVTGVFVADINADRAIVDEQAGTITIVFGSSLHDDPDALFTVTETTVNGTVTIMRVPELPLQTNILAALLPDSPLLLGAEEEIVLTGSYCRTSPNK